MKNYLLLMRLDKPIGFMLLFWPCSWGFAIALNKRSMDNEWFLYLLYFFIGSVLMRSAGCIYNDIVDRKIDQKVKRTKSRPIASNKISLMSAWILIIALCSLSLVILLQFNLNAILFGLASGLLIIFYPFMKRITYWPQLFLGIVFNWGVILSYLVFFEAINLEIILLYLSAIFWTLGYDTIYGMQDLEDDLKIGVKSTAIKFKKNIKLFLTLVYSFSFIILIIANLLIVDLFKFEFIFYLIPMLFLIFQIKSVKINNNSQNLSLFKINNYYGLSIFIIQILVFKHA
ncbi:MAG: 4-hydroxybenzoate octaprenyltransferase [alpha proteobacterium HIMB114]|nr:MAG: 4-hydroxybenzoate octaprenyltransferase [alpha proteobacterium HIMB114]|tara:strand:+ start:6587 stop:7447 length:861 start_codon:yes stop_codon:yes gene_type:complete